MATPLVTVWTNQDDNLDALTDEVNIKLSELSEDGDTVLSVQVRPFVLRSDVGSMEYGWYLAQVVYQARSEASA